jgi:transposase
MKSKELSVDLRDRIVMRHISVEGYKTMSRVFQVSKSTVVSIVGKLKKYGANQALPRVGYLSKLSNWARRTLAREVTKDPLTTLTELQSSLAEMGEPGQKDNSLYSNSTSLIWALWESGQTEAT